MVQREVDITTQRRWIRPVIWLWLSLRFFWVTVSVGLLLSFIPSLLFLVKGTDPHTLMVGVVLDWIGQHLVLSFMIMLLLIVLTALSWFVVYRFKDTPTQSVSTSFLPIEHNRAALVHMLLNEYSRRLTRSLQGAAMMMLELHERTDVIRSSAQLVFRRTEAKEEYPLPLGTSITQAYDFTGQGLLILGEPGVGKTTLLLDLAHELLARAEDDLAHPIPVILNLSSWAIKKQSLATWIIDQMQLVYSVPTRLSQVWLERDHWLLLLDGLDEVEAAARSTCIEAINAYRGEYFAPVVVCSRSHEYLTQMARLGLPSAVIVQPLQEQQVTDYLKQLGKSMAAVRAVLRTNLVLQELITTPLMLNIIILTYRDKAAKDLPQLGSVGDQQQQIFDRYVQRMLEQRAIRREFKPEQMRHWLAWLAREMKQNHLTDFYLERLQPTWVATKRASTIYTLGTSTAFGLIFGIIIGLVFGIIDWKYGNLIGGFARGLVAGLVGWVGGGLAGIVGWLTGRFQSYRRHSSVFPGWSWKGFWRGLGGGLFIGLVVGLMNGLVRILLLRMVYPLGDDLGVHLFFGLLFGFGVGLGIGLVDGLIRGFSGAQITEHLNIKPHQVVHNSGWKTLHLRFVSILVIGLFFGLFFGLIGGLSGFGLAGIFVGEVFVGLFIGLLIGLVFWLAGKLQSPKIYPTDVSVWLWNDFGRGLIGGLIFGLIGGLVIGLIRFLLIRIFFWPDINPLYGLFNGLVSGLVFGLLFGAVGGLVAGLQSQEIHPTDKLLWSWKGLWRGLGSGLVIGLIAGLIVGLFVGLVTGINGGLISGLRTGLIFGLLFGPSGGLVGGLVGGMIKGFSGAQITEHLRIKPNQGIRNSGWNAFRLGFVSILVVGLCGGLFSWLIIELVIKLVGGYVILVNWLLTFLVLGTLFGLALGLIDGGAAYLEHYILRYIIWRSGEMPWHYVRFLEEASEHILLQRVGGGYRFVHPLFQEYFASLATSKTLHAVQKPSLQQP